MAVEDCEARVWVVVVDPSMPADADSVAIVNVGEEEDATVDGMLLVKLADNEADWVEELRVSEAEVAVCDNKVLPITVDVEVVVVPELVEPETAFVVTVL